MSYPQQDAASAVVAKQSFFRLNTLLVSPGDIYESSVGGGYFAIGPESDIANVAVDYFDEANAPTFMNSIAISNWSSAAGVIPAVNDRNYLPLNQTAGRILIRPTDLFNPEILLDGIFGFAVEDQCVIQPRLDVIQYFNQPPSLVPARRDKTYLFESFVTAATGRNAGFLVPFYGRRFASVQFSNPLAPVEGFSISIGLVSFAIGNGGTSGSAAYLVGDALASNVAVAAHSNYFLPILPGDRGPCDALFVSLNVPVQNGYGTGAMLKIITSDREV